MSNASSSDGGVVRTVAAAGVLYATPAELAKQLAYRDTSDVRLITVLDMASRAIDDWCGRTEWPPDAVPSTINQVTLSLAVDMWKQPDATFGIMGLSETGPVRVARDLVARYDSLLIKFYDSQNGWGVA